jgi:competence protein ComEA
MLDPDRRHLLAYVAAAAVLVVLAVRVMAHRGGDGPVASVSMAAPAASRAGASWERPRAPRATSIWVDVAGAVRRPGLYALPAGARVAAALERAGGPRAHADTTAVNLAAKLVDGQQVLVPVRGHAGAVGATGAGPASGGPGGGSTGVGASPGAKISLSSATQEQLEQLDGIGPALAARIIQYRQAHGGFRSIDELEEVSGIGEKRLQALRGSVQP